MEALSLHTGAPTLHWEDNTSCNYVVESKRFTPMVKHVEITVCFLQEQFDNGLFVLKYDKSSVMPAYICIKTFSGPIISWSNKWITEFRFYPTSDTEHYQIMILHDFVVN